MRQQTRPSETPPLDPAVMVLMEALARLHAAEDHSRHLAEIQAECDDALIRETR